MLLLSIIFFPLRSHSTNPINSKSDTCYSFHKSVRSKIIYGTINKQDSIFNGNIPQIYINNNSNNVEKMNVEEEHYSECSFKELCCAKIMAIVFIITCILFFIFFQLYYLNKYNKLNVNKTTKRTLEIITSKNKEKESIIINETVKTEASNKE